MKRIFSSLALVALLSLPSLLCAQTAGTVRDVQIRSIDFASQTLELHNFGSSTWDLDGWRFCSHDEIDGFDYTGAAGLNGQSLDAGGSLFIDWDNNGTGDDTINVNSLGGAWIEDLLTGGVGEAIQIGIYTSGPFGTAANLVDHIQYSFNGADVNGADVRGTVAENAELWTDQNQWIAVDTDSIGLVLDVDPFPGAGASHSPTSYSVLTAVPEPSSLAFLALGIVGLASTRRRN